MVLNVYTTEFCSLMFTVALEYQSINVSTNYMSNTSFSKCLTYMLFVQMNLSMSLDILTALQEELSGNENATTTIREFTIQWRKWCSSCARFFLLAYCNFFSSRFHRIWKTDNIYWQFLKGHLRTSRLGQPWVYEPQLFFIELVFLKVFDILNNSHSYL